MIEIFDTFKFSTFGHSLWIAPSQKVDFRLLIKNAHLIKIVSSLRRISTFRPKSPSGIAYHDIYEVSVPLKSGVLREQEILVLST